MGNKDISRGKLEGIIENYTQSADPQANNKIYQSLIDAVDGFKPQYESLARQEADLYRMPAAKLDKELPTFYGQAGYNPGALATLGDMIGGMGEQMSRTNLTRNLIDARKGRLEDIAASIADQYTSGLNMLSTAGNLMSPIYQSDVQLYRDAEQQNFQKEMQTLTQQWEEREAEKQRAYQAGQNEIARQFEAEQAEIQRQMQMRLSQMSSGGGSSSGGGGSSSDEILSPDLVRQTFLGGGQPEPTQQQQMPSPQQQIPTQQQPAGEPITLADFLRDKLSSKASEIYRNIVDRGQQKNTVKDFLTQYGVNRFQ